MECQKSGEKNISSEKVIDPFDYLHLVALEQLNLFEQNQKLKELRSRLLDDIKELKKEKNSIDSKIRQLRRQL